MKAEEFLNENREKEGYRVICALTDEYVVDNWTSEVADRIQEEQSKLLEIRLFNKDEELRLFRSDIGKEDFTCRTLSDVTDMSAEENYFDEVHFLDIDDQIKQEPDGYVTATGGGRYHLPIQKVKDAKVRIRYYLDAYKETGQPVIKDWRIVELIEGVK